MGTIGIRIVAEVGEEEDRLVIVCSEGAVVHCPDPVKCGVLAEFDVYILGHRWGWIRGDGEPWDGVGERVLTVVNFDDQRGDEQYQLTLAHCPVTEAVQAGQAVVLGVPSATAA